MDADPITDRELDNLYLWNGADCRAYSRQWAAWTSWTGMDKLLLTPKQSPRNVIQLIKTRATICSLGCSYYASPGRVSAAWNFAEYQLWLGSHQFLKLLSSGGSLRAAQFDGQRSNQDSVSCVSSVTGFRAYIMGIGADEDGTHRDGLALSNHILLTEQSNGFFRHLVLSIYCGVAASSVPLKSGFYAGILFSIKYYC